MSQSAVYSDLSRLNAWRFHVKQLKLGHQQRIVMQSNGARPSPRKGRGMEFSEVRLYQPGDDVRHIDWKVSARSQHTHTKLFSEEHERPVVFVVEQSACLFFASQHCFKSVLALDIMALLAWATLNQEDRVGGLVFGESASHWVEPKRQAKSLLHLFNHALNQNQQLTRPGQGDNQAWLNALNKVAPLVHPASRIILVGDCLNLDNACHGVLRQLAKHTAITAIHCEDPIETSLPASHSLALSDGETEFYLDGQNTQQQQGYQNAYQQAWLNQQSSLSRFGIALCRVSTADKPIEALIKQRLLRR
ncbi:DUF58 domain-containing protein [Thiomicrospira microaerophila]|uniref:DUF58 domain-containing protein n=1 Tax=Thiomicrospira microaerophila TaxID=406020 RepID=UPI00200D8FAF|nr:DUF58 domain-containing protein [Thiomicrospira microaerophila]UQB42210.1 DUF58 domain-containing protein [Thiomicrospira microaerophila]